MNGLKGKRKRLKNVLRKKYLKILSNEYLKNV